MNIKQPSHPLEQLEQTIRDRASASPDLSYVASLLAKGRKKTAQKLVEEAAELAIAAVSEPREQIVSEAADVMFHLLVLLRHAEIEWSQVLDELARREGQSGLEEKANR